MNVDLAVSAFLLDVRHFATRRQLTIAADYTSACQRSKPQEPYKTHCLSPGNQISNSCAAGHERITPDRIMGIHEISAMIAGPA
jgi:hypothetical protein